MTSPDSLALGVSGLPLDDIRALIAHFPDADPEARDLARARLAARAASGPDLGGIEEVAVWLAGWRGSAARKIERAQLALFASVAPPFAASEDITAAKETLELTASGGHPASALCYRHGVGLRVYDLALDVPSGDIREDASLSEQDCAATMAFGMEAVAGGLDLLALSRFGGGGDTAAAALASLLYPACTAEISGIIPEAHRPFVAAAGERHGAAAGDAFELLRRIGTRDMAAAVGAILAARTQRVPVLLDGAPTLAAAAVLHTVSPDNISHCRIATLSTALDGVLARMLDRRPLLDFGGAGGEGVGALLAFPLMQSASDILETAVSRAEAGFDSAGDRDGQA